MVAADSPTGFQRIQPLLQAADDVGQRLGLGPGDVQVLLRARGDPGDASHLDLARVYLALEGKDPPAEVDNPPPGGVRAAVPWWVVGVPQGVLQEGLRRVRPVQGVLPRPVVRLQGVHSVGVLQGVLMVLRQGVPVGLRRVASVGPRMGASS